MTRNRQQIAATLGLAAAVALTAAGCNHGPTGGGVFNGDPNVVGGARDKASARDDAPALTPAEPRPENVSGAATSGSTETGAVRTSDPTARDPRQSSPEAATTPPAHPPTKENTGPASGATKPPDRIETGTPRSPQ